MSVLDYRLHIKDNNTVYECECYTTPEEAKPIIGDAQGETWEIKYKGQVCYVGLWNNSNTSELPNGSVKTPLVIKKNGVLYTVITKVINVYKFTVNMTEGLVGQTVTVNCSISGTKTFNRSGSFLIRHGETWTASVAADTVGDYSGVLSATNGTATSETTISCSGASLGVCGLHANAYTGITITTTQTNCYSLNYLIGAAGSAFTTNNGVSYLVSRSGGEVTIETNSKCTTAFNVWAGNTTDATTLAKIAGKKLYPAMDTVWDGKDYTSTSNSQKALPRIAYKTSSTSSTSYVTITAAGFTLPSTLYQLWVGWVIPAGLTSTTSRLYFTSLVICPSMTTFTKALTNGLYHTIPRGRAWTASKANTTGYSGGTLSATSGTISSNATINITCTAASLLYYDLSVGAATNQTYAVTFTKNTTYGGTLPSNVSGQSAAKKFSCPYGSTAKVTYTAKARTVSTKYTASAAVTKTMTSAQSVGAATASSSTVAYSVKVSTSGSGSVYVKTSSSSIGNGSISTNAIANKGNKTFTVNYGHYIGIYAQHLFKSSSASSGLKQTYTDSDNRTYQVTGSTSTTSLTITLTTYYDDYSDSCLMEGTQVLTPSGLIDISALSVGDTVIGGDGGINTITNIVTHRTIPRQLVTFEDKSLYFTADHVIWNKQENKGYWGVIDYDAYVARHLVLNENGLSVKQQTFADSGLPIPQELDTPPTPIINEGYFGTIEGYQYHKIIPVELEKPVVMYDIYCDGSHSMIANGYVVSAKLQNDYNYSKIATYLESR